MKKYMLAVALSGVVLFLWGFFSWAVMPWHFMVANEFASEQAVAQVLKDNAPIVGVYYLPFAEADLKAGETSAFVNVLPNGSETNRGKQMGKALLGQMMSAFLVLLLLRSTSGLDYMQRVGFVALLGLTVGFVSHFPYWNWFGFSGAYVLVTIVDSLIAWTLAGLVLARFVGGERDSLSIHSKRHE